MPEPVQLDDLQLTRLLDDVAAKDRAAFEQFYNATADRLFGLAVRITGSHDLAEEVLNDLYLQVWQQAGRYRTERGSVMAWLAIMCRSRALDIVRRTRRVSSRERPLSNLPPAAQRSVEAPDLLIDVERNAALHGALLQLDADSRQLLALAYFRDCSHGELTRLTGLPLGTVKSKIRRAIGLIKKVMTHAAENQGGAMSKRKIRQSPQVLDDVMMGLLGEAQTPVAMLARRKRKLFSQIMARIDNEESSDDRSSRRSGFVTVRADEGEWFVLAPKIEKKLLFLDQERRVEAYLLRIQPGGEVPRHLHQADEYCLVLEGDVSFDDIHLKAGDFHLARCGSWHETARSQDGALLYLESAA
jgi:RNA polymerase sigma-70 factor, ECF subfamily